VWGSGHLPRHNAELGPWRDEIWSAYSALGFKRLNQVKVFQGELLSYRLAVVIGSDMDRPRAINTHHEATLLLPQVQVDPV
jgi:hypothetical protein